MVHECSQCSFVPDAGTLFTFIVSREQREAATKKPLFVGKFTMPGWSGHSSFYVFRCSECDEPGIDYPHGYRDNGCVYLRCDFCRHELVLYPGRYREVYERDSLVIPPTIWQELKSLWKNRKAIREARKSAAL